MIDEYRELSEFEKKIILANLKNIVDGNAFVIEGFTLQELNSILNDNSDKYFASNSKDTGISVHAFKQQSNNSSRAIQDNIRIGCIANYFKPRYTTINAKDGCNRIRSVFNLEEIDKKYPNCVQCFIDTISNYGDCLKKNTGCSKIKNPIKIKGNNKNVKD